MQPADTPPAYMFYFHSVGTEVTCYDMKKLVFSIIVGLISLWDYLIKHSADVYDGEYFSVRVIVVKSEIWIQKLKVMLGKSFPILNACKLVDLEHTSHQGLVSLVTLDLEVGSPLINLGSLVQCMMS